MVGSQLLSLLYLMPSKLNCVPKTPFLFILNFYYTNYFNKLFNLYCSKFLDFFHITILQFPVCYFLLWKDSKWFVFYCCFFKRGRLASSTWGYFAMLVPSCIHTHTYSLTHTHTLFKSKTYTFTPTHTHSQTKSHANTFRLSPLTLTIRLHRTLWIPLYITHRLKHCLLLRVTNSYRARCITSKLSYTLLPAKCVCARARSCEW